MLDIVQQKVWNFSIDVPGLRPIAHSFMRKVVTVSKRIEEILEVIDEVHKAAPKEKRDISVRHLRLIAQNLVAERRSIRSRTVSDKCWRQLRLKKIAEFDSLLEDWLYHSTNTLKGVLTNYCVNNQDERQVDIFFSTRAPNRSE